jgi:hypothetical protein
MAPGGMRGDELENLPCVHPVRTRAQHINARLYYYLFLIITITMILHRFDPPTRGTLISTSAQPMHPSPLK